MAFIGNSPTSQAFVTDQFNGTGSQTAFTMSVAPAGSTSMIVAVSGVLQDPSTYAVVGTALNFSVAPPAGTGNISVRYLGIPATGVTTTAYRTATEFTATSGQTTFTPPSYTVGYLDVYRNGVLLGSADYTATNGTTVVLATGCVAGDLVETISFLVSSVLNAIPNTTGSISSSNLPAGLTITTPTISSPTISSPTFTGTVVAPTINAGAATALTLQSANTTALTINTSQNSTFAGTVAVPTGTLYPIVSGTAVASTSGTSIDFTGIPSWVKRITVMLNGVSTNGSSNLQIQLGAGSITTSGYLSGSTESGTVRVAYTTGFGLNSAAAINLIYTQMVITNVSGNIWLASFTGNFSQAGIYYSLVGGGNVTLSSTIDRIRITTVNGTDTFDAGTINILYE